MHSVVLWINHELSFDQFHKNANNIYRGSLDMALVVKWQNSRVSHGTLPTMKRILPKLKMVFESIIHLHEIRTSSSTRKKFFKKENSISQTVLSSSVFI